MIFRVNIWKVDSKARMTAEAAIQKRENAKFENWDFLDAFKFFIDEQLKNGVITEVRHKTYYTCWGIWDRMQKYKGKQFRVRDVTTADLFDFRHFIINECDLWETKQETVGIYKKCQKTVEKLVLKKRYEHIYKGYNYVLIRGVEKRSNVPMVFLAIPIPLSG